MKREELTRRDFHRLTAAAMGGLVAGTIAGDDTILLVCRGAAAAEALEKRFNLMLKGH